jgi:hypothetical protein
MSEKPFVLKEIAEPPEVPKEELFSATEVMQAMLKTSKAFRMYLPNNPLLVRFVEELMGKMRSHLAAFGDFRLDIDQFELKYRGKPIYENRDPKESVAFKLYSDGIRSLFLNEGIEDREICEFLDIIGKDRPGDADDDIVTLLWEKDLPNITYVLDDDYLEYDADIGSAAGQSPQQEKIRGIHQSIAPSETAPSPFMVPQNILTITDEELEWLKNSREADEKRNPLEEVTYILSSILVAEKDAAVFREFADIMVNLTSNLIHAGQIKYALSIIKFLRGLAANEQLSPDNRNSLSQATGTFSGDLVPVLQNYLDETENITPNELKDLLTFFGKSAIGRICELLGQIQKMAMRKVILEKLIEFGKESPQHFYPFLTDNRWYLVRNIVFILGRIGDPSTLEAVIRLISHREPRVRKEVLSYLEGLPDLKAKTYMIKFLSDDNSAIRIRAMQVLAAARVTPALKPIFALTTAKDFDDREMAEKKAIYEALGELGSDQMLPLFREMLMKKFWFNKAKEKESVFCAVAGVRKIRTDAALQLLEEASAAKSDDLKMMISQGIRAIAAERAKGGEKP